MPFLPALPDLLGGQAAADEFNAAVASVNIVRHNSRGGYGDLTRADSLAYPLLNGSAAVMVADRDRERRKPRTLVRG